MSSLINKDETRTCISSSTTVFQSIESYYSGIISINNENSNNSNVNISSKYVINSIY